MSDTMCAKTTETSRCRRCGSEFDWLSDGTKIHAGKKYFESDSLLCLERQLNAANDKIKRLEQEIQQLKISNEYAWQKNGKLNERIQSLIKLGLETTRPDGLEQWHEEEEL